MAASIVSVHQCTPIFGLLDHVTALLERVNRARATGQHTAAVRGAWARYFRAQGRYVVSKLLPDLRSLFVEATEREERFARHAATFDDKGVAAKATKKRVQAAFVSGANVLKSELAVAFELDNPRAVAYAERAAAELVTKIPETTREQLRDLLAKGTKEGWSYGKLARELRRKFDEFSSSRAKLIAVTELGNAYSEGTLVAARQLEQDGLRLEKSWLTVGDGRVSDDCQANARAGWIRLDDLFPGGVGRPLQHPRCRCSLLTRRMKPK